MKTKLSGLTEEQLAMVKEAVVSMCLQEEQRKGRRLTVDEVHALATRFEDEMISRLAEARS